MRFDSSDPGVRGMLIDADANRPIRWAIWADIPEDPAQPGEFEAFREEPKAARRRGVDIATLVYRGRCRLRFVPRAPRFRRAAPADVEPLEEARRRLLRGVALPPTIGRECELPTCHALATWSVADEQEIEPAVMADGTREERAVTVGRHLFCDRHYRNPTMVSLRGVESEVQVTARPQW